MEPCTHFKHGGDPSIQTDRAFRGTCDPAEQLQQSRLTGSVPADDPQGLPFFYLKADIPQRVKGLSLLMPDLTDLVTALTIVVVKRKSQYWRSVALSDRDVNVVNAGLGCRSETSRCEFRLVSCYGNRVFGTDF